MATHNELGSRGEDLAAHHLVKKGYQIQERNWYFGKEEIDVIAIQGNELVIVEVKTRNSDFFGAPHQFISKSKQAHLVRAAHAYVQKFGLDLEVRFDVIGVILNGREQRIEHIERAFLPRW
jgi:putative endonuclease